MQKPAHHAPLLVQAPVRALDPDGAAIITVGTAAFAVAGLVCWIELEALVAAGQGWWFWVCVVGFAIGVIGSAVSWTRHQRRKARVNAETVEDTPDPEPVEPPSAG
ncbi:MAG: DUF2530 domain-containing protein [Propionicimonas sp.]|nr:DUF2530 domain-containing protein [Propionicimonas sp.]